MCGSVASISHTWQRNLTNQICGRIFETSLLCLTAAVAAALAYTHTHTIKIKLNFVSLARRVYLSRFPPASCRIHILEQHKIVVSYDWPNRMAKFDIKQ